MNVKRRYGMVVVAALLITVYTLSQAGKFHVVDEVSLFAVTESLSLRGEIDTNAIAWTQWVNSPGEVLGAFGPDGEVYSKKGPAPAFAAVPWHVLMRFLARAQFSVGLVQATLLWNGFITAITALVLWECTRLLGYEDRTGGTLALLYGLCTIAWPYANQFFGEPLSALALMGTFGGILAWRKTGRLRWLWLAGMMAGTAIASVTAHAVAVLVLVGYGAASLQSAPGEAIRDGSGVTTASRNGQRIVWAAVALLAPVALAALLLLTYNQLRFGNPFDTGYHFDSGEGFSTPIWEGAWGLIFSPYRGIIWHTPLVIASVVGFAAFLRRHVAEAVTIAALTGILVALYSTWWMWWGGFAWGPRFLVPLVPFWVLVLAPMVAGLFERLSAARLAISPQGNGAALMRTLSAVGVQGWVLLVTATISFLVQVGAVTVNFVNFEIRLRSLYPTDWEDPLAFGPPALALTDLWNSPVGGQFRLMSENFVVNTDLAWLWADGNIQWLVVLVGGVVLLSLCVAAVLWFAGLPDRAVPSKPVRWMIPVLPALFLALWIGEVSRNPHYGEPGRGYRAVLEEICSNDFASGALITVAPYAYQIPMNWLGTLCSSELPVYGYAPSSMQFPEAGLALDRVLAQNDAIWFVTGGLPANDPDNSVERWLADKAFKANDIWFDDFRLLAYATAGLLANIERTDLDVPLVGDGTSQVHIVAARVAPLVTAGSVAPVEIVYELDAPSEFDLRWFVQMLAETGEPVALLDTAPLDGYVPFSQLPAGEKLVERAGLHLPPTLQSGVYNVIGGLYNPDAADAGRLRAPDGSDFAYLGRVVVQ